MKSENNLFVDLTNEEASKLTGGLAPAVVAGVKVAVAIGGVAGAGAAVTNLTRAFGGWLSRPGNGFIIGDRKGSSRDWRRAGDISNDAPHGWNWGVRNRGQWIAGGYNGPRPS